MSAPSPSSAAMRATARPWLPSVAALSDSGRSGATLLAQPLERRDLLGARRRGWSRSARYTAHEAPSTLNDGSPSRSDSSLTSTSPTPSAAGGDRRVAQHRGPVAGHAGVECAWRPARRAARRADARGRVASSATRRSAGGDYHRGAHDRVGAERSPASRRAAQHALGRHRQPAQAHADRVLDRARQRRRGRPDRRLADPAGAERALAGVQLEPDRVDVGQVERGRDQVVGEQRRVGSPPSLTSTSSLSA